ncbi:MAG: thiamine pyrophosphate-dependent dehydrogenase E1 component subunit alpha [Calditrichaeota bacterium]|nr:thiamine pyrophosphate-dependent dehydrogenase E1 component subunit alpha [Calditrichota bacterium]
MDLWVLYKQMLRSRLFEEAVSVLWNEGLISGEMHLGTGEEGIIAGIVTQLQEGDSLALDHRGTSALLMRGIDPILLMKELLGLPDGLCSGRSGHMHLFSPELLAASSGIVGSTGPAATGFALAARYLRTGKLSISFFGEGAMNQGMMMESFNLAVTWNLPVIFVCKDDKWSITTHSRNITAGNLTDRAAVFGMPTYEVDGSDVREVWISARKCLNRARAGLGPSFILATCSHLEGHFLGDPLLRTVRKPLSELPGITIPLMKSLLQSGGASALSRLEGLTIILNQVGKTIRDRKREIRDPVKIVRKLLVTEKMQLEKLEAQVFEELAGVISSITSE